LLSAFFASEPPGAGEVQKKETNSRKNQFRTGCLKYFY
jgi:hypothetical protein